MNEQEVDVSEMMDVLVDWFETIEEIELSDGDRTILMEVAESLTASKNDALRMGIQTEDFDDWLQVNVLDQWSAIMEDLEDAVEPVQSFYDFAKNGEQGLYLQMLKRCISVAEAQSA